MMADSSESQIHPKRKRFFRPSRLLFAVIALAALSGALIATARRFRSDSSREAFQSAIEAMARGDWNQARRNAQRLEELQHDSAKTRFLRGVMLLEKGFCYPALDEFQAAKHDVELETDALTLMGEAWYRLGRHLEAQETLRQVLKQEPDSVDAHRWLAASCYDLGDIANANYHLERTAALDPTDPRPHRLLGLILKDFQQFEPAIRSYQESLRRKNDQPEAQEIRQELATCQLAEGRYADALATLDQCSELPKIDVLRAQCHYAQGNVDRAKKALSHALEVEGGDLDGLLLRGTILLEEGDARTAIEVLQRAVNVFPKDYAAHFKLARAYSEAGEQESAEVEHQTAEKIRVIRDKFSALHKKAWEQPNDVQTRVQLAALAQELDRPDLAEVWLNSVAALQSPHFSEND